MLANWNKKKSVGRESARVTTPCESRGYHAIAVLIISHKAMSCGRATENDTGEIGDPGRVAACFMSISGIRQEMSPPTRVPYIL